MSPLCKAMLIMVDMSAAGCVPAGADVVKDRILQSDDIPNDPTLACLAAEFLIAQVNDTSNSARAFIIALCRMGLLTPR